MARESAPKKRPGRKPKEHTRVQLKFDAELLRQVDAEAEKSELTRTAWLEQAATAYLSKTRIPKRKTRRG